MARTKRILILTSNYGHASMAEAVEESLVKVGQVKVVNVAESSNGSVIFGFFYRYAPSLFKYVYQLGRIKAGGRIYDNLSGLLKFRKDIVKEISGFKPDLVINTNYSFEYQISRARRKHRFVYFNLVHEAWAEHPILYSKTADLNLVYDRKGARIAKKYGVKKTAEIGWLVRERFYQKKVTNSDWARMGFKRGVPTVLLFAGSDGANAILKILPAILSVKKRVQIIAVVGRNESLYYVLQSVSKIFGKSVAVWESRVKIKVLRYVKDVERYMAMADLVMGRAGPQTLFESVAAGKPFLVLTHMSGHQDNVLEVVKKKNLGVVQERAKRAERVFLDWLSSPGKWRRYQKGVERERKENMQAGKKLERQVREYLGI